MRNIPFFTILMLFQAQSGVIRAQKANTMLIRPSTLQESRLSAPNLVYVVSEKDLVTDAETLFKENKAYNVQQCQALWLIDFWETPAHLLDEVPYNPKCDLFKTNSKQIQGMMLRYTDRITSNAPWYLYNVKISATVPPQTVIDEIGASSQIFFVNGVVQHLPLITLHYMYRNSFQEMSMLKAAEVIRKTAETKVREIIDALELSGELVHQSKVVSMQSGANSYEGEDLLEVALRFKKGTDLEKIARIIAERGGIIHEKQIPEHYYVQLASRQRGVSVVQAALVHFPFVQAVMEYPIRK
ncbi:MAG: hypothetical protein RL329_2297 [Bacteroidota bacterium]|jgi:hypothetical protein